MVHIIKEKKELSIGHLRSLDKLPEGESASPPAGGSADFVIIVGEDKK